MESSFLGLRWLWWFVMILFLLFIIIIVMGSSTKTYFPAINIGNGGFQPAVTGVSIANGGVASVSINATAVNAAPTGFTFLGDWAFNTAVGQTGGTVTLSNNNKAASVANGLTTQGILIGNKALTGKVMYSVNMMYPGQTPGCNGVGIATGGFNAVAAGNAGTGADIGFVGYDKKSYALYDNGTVNFNDDSEDPINIVNGPTFQKTNGTNVVDVAIDIPNLKIWFRVDNGLWNASAIANPVTNVGGYDISKMTN
jgi:hypothetical protein